MTTQELDKLAYAAVEEYSDDIEDQNIGFFDGYQAGFRKALELAYQKLNANRLREDACAVLMEEFYWFL